MKVEDSAGSAAHCIGAVRRIVASLLRVIRAMRHINGRSSSGQ